MNIFSYYHWNNIWLGNKTQRNPLEDIIQVFIIIKTGEIFDSRSTATVPQTQTISFIVLDSFI